MRRLTAAVFGTIGLVVAAATAHAIENSTWYSDGEFVVDVRTAGQPRFTAVGPFENTYTGIFSNQVFLSGDEVTFTNNLTATSTSFFPGTPTFEPFNFTQTTARFGVDFDAPPSGIDYPGIITGFAENMLDNLLDVPVNFIDATTTTSNPSTFQGIEVFRPTLRAGGTFRAFDGFSQMKGGFTVKCKGRTFISGDRKVKGRKTTIKILVKLLGQQPA